VCVCVCVSECVCMRVCVSSASLRVDAHKHAHAHAYTHTHAHTSTSACAHTHTHKTLSRAHNNTHTHILSHCVMPFLLGGRSLCCSSSQIRHAATLWAASSVLWTLHSHSVKKMRLRWMDGARLQYNGTLQMVPHLHSMGRVRKHPNWKIWEFSLGPDFLRISCQFPTKILVRKYCSKLFSWNGQKVH